MWKRFSRWMRSVFGGAVDSLEDPEKILQQNIRDMTDQIPAMNENIAIVKANVTLSEKALDKARDKEQRLRERIKAALSAGAREEAVTDATQLESARTDVAAAEENLELARKSVEKALKVKEIFLAERDRRIKEAVRAIDLARQAAWQDRVARAMATFDAAGLSATHEEMLRKIEERSARAQARLELALDGTGHRDYDRERETERRHADELVRQFEIEMGLTPAALPTGEKTMGPAEAESERRPAAAERVKTMGPSGS